MNNSKFIDFSDCSISNDLWPAFINNIGFFKAKLAVRQSLDLQNMQGTKYTLPVLFIDTCGSALLSTYSIKSFIGLTFESESIVLIYSKKMNSAQLLREI